MLDYYRKNLDTDGVSRAVFVERAIEAYVRQLNQDYRGDDIVVHRLNQVLEEIKVLHSEMNVNNLVLNNGFDTLFNLTID